MRLLLVEDDPRLARLVVEGLGEDGLIVDHAPNASVGEGMARLETYDLLVLDVMLPEGREAGFELARTLRDWNDRTPILFLTARVDIDSKLEGLETGGDDYLGKPFDFRELRARVRALVRRSKGEATNLVPLPQGLRLDLGAHEVSRDGERAPLTPREYALVECLALAPGRTYSRSSLIERVWPEDSEVDLKAVDVFVSTVRRKLGEDVIETVRGVGYRLGRLETRSDSRSVTVGKCP
jgi:two-component system response regulator QseB